MKTFLKFLLIWWQSASFKKARFFAGWEGAANNRLLKQISVHAGTQTIYHATGGVFGAASLPLFNRSLSLLDRCVVEFQAREEKGELWLHTQCHGQSVRARMANHESLLCMHEVFDLEAYQLVGIGTCVVIDVGMNIGLASLYLAALPEVETVYGYELVGATAAVAGVNIAANTYAANKVKATHAGIAKQAGNVQLPITGAGDVGAHLLMEATGAQATETVQLLAAVDLVKNIHEQHPGKPIVLKLDCEGAEYEIIQSLADDNVLQEISVCMIEWHKLGSKPLTDLLCQHGFLCFTPGLDAAQPTGFVYAAKT